MNVDAHLEALRQKHGEIERQLHEALTHPSIDDADIHDLKRRKLHLKDEIERLKANGGRAGS